MIQKFKAYFKKANRLTVKHVYTFKTGEKLYTYDTEDFGNISYRYHRNIQETLKYLELFAVTKEQWESAIKLNKENILAAVDNPSISAKNEALLDINSSLDWFKAHLHGVKTKSESLQELFFCTFYLLENETKYGYDEEMNKKKIQLLNDDLEARDFFFRNLPETINSYQRTLTEDIYKTLNHLQNHLISMQRITTKKP